MTFLLDTQVLLWFDAGDARLSAAARQAIESPANERYISHASAWEVAIKLSLSKLTLPFHHRDPFDRLLVAQAKVEALTLITADAQLANYGVPVLW